MQESIYRLTERSEFDPLGTDKVREIARSIMRAIGDPNMHPMIATRVARAVIERKVSPDEIATLCDTVECKRKAGQLRVPGAYFLQSVRRIFQREEIPW